MRRLFLPLFALPLFALPLGCVAPTDTPERLYQAVIADLDVDTMGGFKKKVLAEQEERYAQVVKWYESGALISGEDYLWASATLTTSDNSEHLDIAQTLAQKAIELGEERGYTLQAYATDKIMVARSSPNQRFGTVIIYEPVLGRYQLYPVDPFTTDEVRRSMGIPPLVQLLAEVDALNEMSVNGVLRDSLVRRLDDDEPAFTQSSVDFD